MNTKESIKSLERNNHCYPDTGVFYILFLCVRFVYLIPRRAALFAVNSDQSSFRERTWQQKSARYARNNCVGAWYIPLSPCWKTSVAHVSLKPTADIYLDDVAHHRSWKITRLKLLHCSDFIPMTTPGGRWQYASLF